MGGFLGIGNASYKTDRSNELGGFAKLGNVFNFGLNAAKTGVSAGQDLLSSAGSYFKNLLSGNRSAVSQAVAPETAAIRSGSDASARQLAASGTARGGGVASTNQQRTAQTQAKVDQAILGARPAAAAGAEKVGATQLQGGLDAAAIASRAAADTTQTALEARAQDFKINQSIVGDYVNLAADAFAAFA